MRTNKAKIYTKTGDAGQTSLVGGTRVPKTHVRIEAYGTLDELNSSIGLLRAHLTDLKDKTLREFFEGRLQTVQASLFSMGSLLACEDEKLKQSLPRLDSKAITDLEGDLDLWESELPVLKKFILPGGAVLAAQAHVARTVCRRAERATLRLSETTPIETELTVYLNRLSDWLFLASRKFNAVQGFSDIIWG